MKFKLETLSDYRLACIAIGGEDCAAVEWLDRKIEQQGSDQAVLADETQMMALLGPMMLPR
jgi:hypothetical protein